ncbi:MAG: alpha/beta hydrolase [Pseudomonadota bacterium]|nr:alpha/beta hydrolase [Pseudomonadota bacterium]
MLLLLALACTGVAPKDGDTSLEAPPVDLVDALAAPGPWSVGHQDASVVYADTIGGGERTLHLSVWYPTTATSGDDATYFSGALTAEGVWQDAPVADGPFPLAVFSHGHQAYAEASGFLMEHLASHGWVVAAPDHTGNTTFDGSDRATEIYAQRPRDLSAVLDWMGTSAYPLTETRVVMGHSFGGYTVLATIGATFASAALDCPDPTTGFCSTMTPALRTVFEGGLADTRFGAALLMAPGDFRLFESAGIGAITLPTMLMTGTEDQPPGSEVDEIWAALRDAPGDSARRVTLDGAGHQSFTDFADTMEDVTMSAEASTRIVDVYALAWARRADGDADVAPVLDGEREVAPEAVLAQ